MREIKLLLVLFLCAFMTNTQNVYTDNKWHNKTIKLDANGNLDN